MGKTVNWFRSLLGSKKKSKYALSKSADYSNFKNEESLATPYADGLDLDANKHAIAVAAATAAVAEAALAAAQAAAEVVRLTSSTGSGWTVPAYVRCDRRRVAAAAIKIQSAFRAYLAKRALRALKGLVKLQALVRGHIVRRQSADMLRRMQAMARIQARASAHRYYVSDSSKKGIKFSNYQPLGVLNPRNYYQWPDNGGYNTKESRMSNTANRERSHMASSHRLNQWMEQHSWNNRHDSIHGDDERSDKILEIDTWKPRQSTRRSDRARNGTGQECPSVSSISCLSAKLQKPNPSISSEEVSYVLSPKEVDQVAVWTAESSPRMRSASSRPGSNLRGTFTPTRSECSRSLCSDYLSHPNYMANTESSRAKARSQSAPKQRMQLDKHGVSSTSSQNIWESDAVSEKGYALPPNYKSHTYQKRQGAPTPGVPHSMGYRF